LEKQLYTIFQDFNLQPRRPSASLKQWTAAQVASLKQ